MKITIYELLGMIKDGKAPKKIKFNNSIYEYHDKEHGYCRYYHDNTYICLDTDYYLFDILNDEVEILEEEKKIPEKLYLSDYEDTTGKFDYDVLLTINEIIDYLDYLKSKGE